MAPRGEFGTELGARPAKISRFGLGEKARSFVHFFDHTDSMISTLSYSSEGKTVFAIAPLKAAHAEQRHSLKVAGENQGFQIFFPIACSKFLKIECRPRICCVQRPKPIGVLRRP